MDLAKKVVGSPTLGQGIRRGNISERLLSCCLFSHRISTQSLGSPSHKDIFETSNQKLVFEMSGWQTISLLIDQTGIPLKQLYNAIRD